MTQIRCSIHRLNTESLAYLLENGFYIMLFIPNAHSSLQRKFLNAIFGPNVDSIQKIQPELVIYYIIIFSFINRFIFLGFAKIAYSRVSSFE